MSKVMNLLGLAQRAGKVVSGDFIVEKPLRARVLSSFSWPQMRVLIMKRNTDTYLMFTMFHFALWRIRNPWDMPLEKNYVS